MRFKVSVFILVFLSIFVCRDTLFTPKEYHKFLLANSKFNATKDLSRKERKSRGMPPNSYHERFYELTQNPYLGYPTSQKKVILQNSLANDKIRGSAFAGKTPGEDSNNAWVSIGPNNVGGRTRGALFDINDSEGDRVIAGGVSGGLWLNDDIDSSTNSAWTMLTGVPGNLSVSVIVQDPNHPNVMYAGTGESYTNSDAMGNGIYKSTDYGVNWTRVFGVDYNNISVSVYSGQAIVEGSYFINDLQIWDPTPSDTSNSDEVIFATVGQGSGFDGELNEFYDYQTHGLYKSTDGGANWSKISLPNNSNGRSDDLNDIEIDLSNKIWISTTRNVNYDEGGNFYSSTDGSSFTQTTPTYPSVAATVKRVEFVPSSTETNTFYILLNASEAEIYKTTDAFSNLTKLTEPNDADRGIPSNDFTRNQAFYDLEIEVDPNDGDIVYVGGINWFRSTDGGANWTQITKWSENADMNGLSCSVVHADQHGMYFKPGDSDKAIVINDGGVYYARSLSSASTSSTAFVSQESGFITTQFYRVAQMPLGVSSSDDLIIGGTQDNGTLIIDNTDFSAPASSYEFMGGDGGYTYIDQIGGDYLLANYVYNNSLLLYNLNGLDLGGGVPYTYLSDDSDADTSDDNEGDFINPGGLDSNLDILYVNGSSGGNYSIRRFFDLDTASPYDNYISGLHASPTAFKVSPFNTTSTTLFVGYEDGVLQRLDNAHAAGVTATNLADFIGSVSDIEFGASEDEIYVTYYNYGVTNIYYTSDGGTTWSAKDGDLPDLPVLSIMSNPFESNEVIIGTDLGVWMTQDFSVSSPTWVQSNNGMTDVRVNDLQYRGTTVSNNRVVASTYGRGIFVGSFDSNDETAPTVALSHSAASDVVALSEVVTITATFSESMAASPTISLSGVVTDVLMTATTSNSVWTYTWTVSSLVTETIATVSGTDLSDNAYAGSTSITFTVIDRNPAISINHPDLIVSYNDNPVALNATYVLSQTDSPTLLYTDFGGTTTLTMNVVSGTTDRKQWEYNLFFSGPDEQKQLSVGSSSLTVTFDSTPSSIYSVTVNENNTAVDVIFTEDLFADYISHTATGTVVASDFSLTISSTTASLTSATPTSLSVTNTALTDGKKYTLGFSLNGATSVGDAITVGVSTHTYDIAGNGVSSSQTTNTSEFSNIPPYIVSLTLSSNNSLVEVLFSEPVYATASSTTSLSSTSFNLGLTGARTGMSTPTITSITSVSSKLYQLALSYTVSPSGLEQLLFNTEGASIYDVQGASLIDEQRICELIDCSAISYSVQLNDQLGPTITANLLDDSNNFIDLAFSEGVYGQVSPSTAISSDSFVLTQLSGETVTATITDIGATNVAATALSPGATEARVYLSFSDNLVGGEIFSIDLANTATVVDQAGNAMTVSQTNNTFTLNQPVSGPPSPINSTIVLAPNNFIADSEKVTYITINAIDSLGQSFTQGGYDIKVQTSLEQEIDATDSGDGSYYIIYTPERLPIYQSALDIIFSFTIDGVPAVGTATLTVYGDEDQDGVSDLIDDCPATSPGYEVDENGCADHQKDSDGDGVTDDLDQCPDTPIYEEIYIPPGTVSMDVSSNLYLPETNLDEPMDTIVDEHGCSASQRDTDEDGIADLYDNCPETPNPSQLDSDFDGIGDECDTDNPYPVVDLTPLVMVEGDPNGTVIGEITAEDPDGETVSFTLAQGPFTGILDINSTTGEVTIINTSQLRANNTAFNGALLEVIVSDGVNAFNVFIELQILAAPAPPQISVVTFEVSEDAPVGTLVGLLQIINPMGGDFTVEFDGKGYFELVGNQILTTTALDYETIPTAEGPNALDTGSGNDRFIEGAYEVTVLVNAEELSAFEYLYIPVTDIPNTVYTGNFFISVFDIINESVGAKVDHTRYLNPAYTDRTGVGKWKVKKKISGGADANLFVIRETNPEQKNEDEVQIDDNSFLDFITPPDFENPQDHNRDNIYEVEITYINEEDGSILVPVPVTQFQLQVPENATTAIQIQSIATEPTTDSDGDGIVDILDNAPLVSNADQTDLDGDGIGDVSDDFDHDGVFNPYDNCAETPLGELVDVTGCEIFYLPPDNFSLSKTEKCIDTNSITVGVLVTDEVYDVHVTGSGTEIRDSFTGSSWTLDSLSAGTYNVCFTAAGIPSSEFERCFEVTITEPDPLSVYATMSSDQNRVLLNLAGGQVYNVTHNGKTTQTKDANYSVTLSKGYNKIRVDTGVECQGVFEHEYFVSNEVRIAPNPFSDQLMIYVSGEDRSVNVEVFTSQGILIHSERRDLDAFNRSISLTTSGYQQGSYIIKVTGETTNRTITAIKE